MFLTRRSASVDRSPWGDFYFQPVGSFGGSARVTPDSALAISAVYACVRVLAESFALLPPKLYRTKVGGGRQEVTDHWLYRLLAKAPNRWQSPFEWREMLQAHLALRGNAFCLIVEDGRGGIAELLPLHPDRVRLELVDEWGFRYVYTDRGGRQTRYRPDQIWHLRGLSGDGFLGYNPIELQRESLGEAMQYQSYSSRFYANNATPPAWIKFPGKFADKAARQSFREQMQEAQTSANRGKLMVLDQGMELNALSINQKDMQFVEARGMKVPEVARMFRVPPHKIGDLSRATFSNIEQQSIEFWQDTMQPVCERWESSLERNLLGEDSGIEVEYFMRAQMRGDSVARKEYVQGMVLSGVITPNEGREIEGFDPVEGGDERLVPVNMRKESDPDPNGEQGAGEQLPDVPGAGQDDQADDEGAGAGARLARVLAGNADRMARRIEAGQPPSADVLADALAISEQFAAEILASADVCKQPRHVLATMLLGFGLKGKP